MEKVKKKDMKRRKANYEALSTLFQRIDTVLHHTESFPHIIDYGEKGDQTPEDHPIYKDLNDVITRFNEVFIKNRNKLSDRLKDLIDNID